MSIGYKPIMGRVLIKRDKIKEAEVKVGNILVPIEGRVAQAGSGEFVKKLNTGVVVALGESVDHPDIQLGVRVHWGKNAGADIQPDYLHQGKIDGEEYFICMEEDILGVFETENEKENEHGKRSSLGNTY